MRRLLLLWLILSTWAPHAHAQSEEYERAVQAGLDEYAAGHYEEARQLFLSAHAIQPNARTLRGLGMTEFELRRYPEALGYFEGALASDVKPLSGDLRIKTQELLERTRKFVGRVRLLLQPDDAEVEVDGAASERTDELVLGVGRHELVFRATGRKSQTRVVEILGGQQRTLTVELAPQVEAAPSDPLDARGHDDARAHKRKRRWLWATLGVVVVAGAATALAIALQPSHEAQFDKGDLGVAPRL